VATLRIATLLAQARTRALALVIGAAFVTAAHGAGGPLGIDHRLNYDNSGIWGRNNQNLLFGAALVGVAGAALWEGDASRFGHTMWQTVDAVAIGLVTAGVMKPVFSRSRPRQTDDPSQWFQGKGHNSFPSNEVMAITTSVTPLILEYGSEYPAVWTLALLPVYDGIARMKVQAHWQTDVLASLAIGSAVGYYTHSRTSSITVGLLPGGFTVGWKKSF
jgi:undecaprenyl-diphosphatase